MSELEEIFAKEFKAMCQQRKAMTGAINLHAISVPEGLSCPVDPAVSKMSKVRIKGVQEEYFSQLNDTDVYLWVRPRLMRRTFDCDGRFIRDSKTNKYITKDVTLPQNCCAIVTEKSIKVPLKFKSREDFEYVDYATSGNKRYMIYIVPKRYCYKVNELCMVMSFTRLRSVYSAMELKLMSGHTLYVSVIPYNPRKAHEQNYRVLSVQTSRDFSKQWKALKTYWVANGVLFPEGICALSEPIKDVMNVAYRELDPTLEDYQIYDYSKSLADTGNDSFDDMEEGEGVVSAT